MTDEHEPPVHQRADNQQHGSSSQAGRSRLLLERLGMFTLAQVSATIIAMLVGAGLALLGSALLTKPTTAQQIQEFELRQGAEGYTLVQELSGDLRGDGTESFALLMRNGAGERFPLPKANSDRLFIFDDNNGTLRQAFEFQPAVAHGETGDAIEPYVGRIDGLFDAFGTGRQDIVGSWNYYLIAGGQYAAPRPFVISWNIARGRYEMTPILKADVARSAITKVRNPGIAGRVERPGYLNPLTLHDVNSSATFTSVDAEDYAPTMRNGHLVLVAAYVLRGPGLLEDTLWQVVPYSLQQAVDVQTAVATETSGSPCSTAPIFMHPGGQPYNDYTPAAAALATWRTSGPTGTGNC
jgi:hypothetical protein